MEIRPVTLADAKRFIVAVHRHHDPPVSAKFAIGAYVGEQLVAVATVGRPVSRMLDDGLTAEVTRVASDGTRNACSFLYARAKRAAQALGYQRIVTYTLESETGVSLKAAGWRQTGESAGGSWDRVNRERTDHHPLQGKIRWEA